MVDSPSESENPYRYALSLPTRHVDPLGLYTIDGNCGSTLPSLGRDKAAIESKARAEAQKIDEPSQAECNRKPRSLRQCVLTTLDTIKVRCNKTSASNCAARRTDPIATTQVGMTDEPSEAIDWCKLGQGDLDCLAKLLVHETAHACGWDHGEGKNVPFNDGKANCFKR
ncbi:MAG: hypothetical protein INH37_22115 [Myxococcaceae bacterium]|nr:hypothetical protein [Myxococcaceae bacterium]